MFGPCIACCVPWNACCKPPAAAWFTLNPCGCAGAAIGEYCVDGAGAGVGLGISPLPPPLPPGIGADGIGVISLTPVTGIPSFPIVLICPPPAMLRFLLIVLG